MSVLLVVGYGPGISQAVATRFAREGFSLALVARSSERTGPAAERFGDEGVTAAAFQADASDPEAMRRVVSEVQAALGSISAILFTAFRGGAVKNVLDTRPEDIEHVFDVGVAGLLACVQAALADLVSTPGASVLVANGALGEHSSEADGYAKYLDNDGVALENAAKSKLVGILAERLRESGVYVGEVTIAGSVAGTATAQPSAIPAERIAEQFWSLTQSRDTTRVRMTPEPDAA